MLAPTMRICHFKESLRMSVSLPSLLASTCLRCGVQRGASALQGYDPGEPPQRPRPGPPTLQRPRGGDAHRGRRAVHARHHRSVALARTPKAAFANILFMSSRSKKAPAPSHTHTNTSVSLSSGTLMFLKIMSQSLGLLRISSPAKLLWP